MNLKSKIISCFPLVGRHHLAQYQTDHKVSVLYIDSSKFSQVYRKRTAEELEEIKKEWDAIPHLLSGQGYINHIKDELILDNNPAFPTNYIQNIQLHNGKYDIILVDADTNIRKSMQEAGIKYTLVYPSNEMYCEWVGRCYLKDQEKGNSYHIKLLQLQWRELINSCNDDSSDKIIINQPNKFLSDYIPIIKQSINS